MFDEFRLKEALVSYKRDFAQKLWPNEKYKWQAVKCFQLNWDVNATNFAEMLMYGKVSQENYVELTAASAIPNKEIKSPQILRY